MTTQQITPPYQIRAALRPKHTAEFLSIGLSTLWYKAKHDPDFPKPVKLGPRTTVWFTADLADYLNKMAGGEA